MLWWLMIDLFLGDCMDIMPKYDDNHFDLAIVDPPYGLNNDGGNIGGAGKNFIGKLVDPKPYKQKDWDKESPNGEYFNELIRVSKNQIIWGGNYFPYLWVKGCKAFIFWYKKNYTI